VRTKASSITIPTPEKLVQELSFTFKFLQARAREKGAYLINKLYCSHITYLYQALRRLKTFSFSDFQRAHQLEVRKMAIMITITIPPADIPRRMIQSFLNHEAVALTEKKTTTYLTFALHSGDDPNVSTFTQMTNAQARNATAIMI